MKADASLARNAPLLPLTPSWRRVRTSPLGASFALFVDAGGRGRALIVDGSTIRQGPDERAATLVATAAGAIVFAKAHARGVSLLIGWRARNSAASISYIRHFVHARDGRVDLRFVLNHTQPTRSRASRPYAYALPLPHAGDAHARYGARVFSALGRATFTAHAASSPPRETEPRTGRTALPADALQAAAFIASVLERS